jgi:hypothetical protein
MQLKINQPEAKILLEALADCRLKKLTRGRCPEQIQDLYSRLYDHVHNVAEKPVSGRTYNKKAN